jgi:hypothetical protein
MCAASQYIFCSHTQSSWPWSASAADAASFVTDFVTPFVTVCVTVEFGFWYCHFFFFCIGFVGSDVARALVFAPAFVSDSVSVSVSASAALALARAADRLHSVTACLYWSVA